MITSQPTDARPPRPIWNLTRRLGVQAALSVTVMAGLQLASVNGYDVRDLLPARAPEAAGPTQTQTRAEPTGVVGVPARFDIPVQAGSALDHLQPGAPAGAVASVSPRVASSEASKAGGPAPRPAPLAATLPSAATVAVPTPRPRLVAAARPAARPAAVPPRPGEMPFDTTPRAVEVYGVADLAEEAPPEPMQMADAGFRVGDLVPSGEAILLRTAEATGSAAHAVTGTATRLLDLVR